MTTARRVSPVTQAVVNAYQTIFNPNWISLPGVCVEVIWPKPGTGPPVEEIASRLPPAGGAKLVWLKRLKNSARNCMLKFSENFLIGISLIMEKSKLTNPGPMSVLRPKFPMRLKHWGKVPKVGSQFAL